LGPPWGKGYSSRRAIAFRAIDGLITNFHLPRSTLFMLVSALMGLETMKAAYAHAIEAGYRFYSYGDSSLLLPE
jgi:S-adenosylmethionine:tRNA ribosyltransferase-isomerase